MRRAVTGTSRQKVMSAMPKTAMIASSPAVTQHPTSKTRIAIRRNRGGRGTSAWVGALADAPPQSRGSSPSCAGVGVSVSRLSNTLPTPESGSLNSSLLASSCSGDDRSYGWNPMSTG